MSKDCAPTIARRIRTRRFDDANEKCKASNQPNQLSALFTSTRPFTTALPTLRQGIDHIGDSFEFGCELPRLVRRKHRVRAAEIDMHLVINRQDRTSGDERDARFGLHIEGCHEISFKYIL